MSVVLSCRDEGTLRREMYNRIKKELEDIRAGKVSAERVILVVPAQSTLLTEEESFDFLGGEGFIDFAVMSGTKLRSTILDETGHPGRTAIGTVGRKMLLRRIAAKREAELRSYSGVCRTDGFLDIARDFIINLKQNGVSPDTLDKVSKSGSFSGILASKLSDICLIYSDYEKAMEGKYTDTEDLLSFTAEKIAESDFIKTSIIWYSGFYSFSKREYGFLLELGKYAAGMNAAVLAGKDRYLCGEDTAAKLSAALGARREILPSPEGAERKIRTIACTSPYTQSRTIAADILTRVREGCGYGDIVVITGDMEEMGENLRRILGSFGIPVFMDEKRSMSETLAARVISSCLDMTSRGVNRQSVLAFLKTGILDYTQDEIYAFESYAEQYKIYDSGFLKPFKYGKDAIGEEKFGVLEGMRAKIEELFVPFIKDMNEARTAGGKSEVFYRFLAGPLDFQEFIRKVSAEFEAEHFHDASEENPQCFKYTVDLMDQMDELLGDEEINKEEYSELFKACLGDVKIGLLPQAEGRVRIGSITRTSFSDVKYLYIAGFNDGLIPSDNAGEGLLTESEIDALAGENLTVAKSPKTLQDEEMFQIERALNTDTEETVICWCRSDLSGNALRKSALLSDLPVDGASLSE